MRSGIFMALLLSCVAAIGSGREDVTFILGRDENPSSPMYHQAERFFRDASGGAHAPVVSGLRSLREVRDYLNEHTGEPWGLVQLVVHGNGAGQMTLPLVPGGEFISAKSLAAAIDQGAIKALPDDRMDHRSEIRILGCALGQNPELLRTLSRALGGSDPERPLVRASRYYTCYQARGTATPIRFMSEAWRIVHPIEHPPAADDVLARIQKERPGTNLNIVDALTRHSPRFPGDTFSYRAPATFHWTMVLRRPEDCPLLSDPVRLRCWLGEQMLFFRRLNEADLEIDQMDWTAERTSHFHEGCERPAVKVKGTGEALYILRSLTVEPDWNDPAVFAIER